MPHTLSGDTGVSKADTNSVDTAAIQALAVTPAKLSQPLTLAASQATTSGSNKDYLGIPSWAKRLTLSLSQVSSNGILNVFTQLGTSAGIAATGYDSMAAVGVTCATSTTGFALTGEAGAVSQRTGTYVFTKISDAANTWVCSAVVSVPQSPYLILVAGTVTLPGVLDRVRLSCGTDTLDNGLSGLLIEG